MNQITNISYQLRIRQLQKKKQEEAEAAKNSPSSASNKVQASQIRLQKDITELDLPKSIQVTFPDPDNISQFSITIKPQEGYYRNGKFNFQVNVNDNFPIEPPKIKCTQKVYHPNIDLDGNVCLNILREDWSPALNLNSVIIGLNYLFVEPNPTDPLNKEAANDLKKNPGSFSRNVLHSMRGSYVNNEFYDRVI